MYGRQEGGCPVIIEKNTGLLLAAHCTNFEHNENKIENIEVVGTELMATAREIKPATGSKLMK